MIPQIIFYKNVEYINIYTFNFVLKNDILLKSFWNKFSWFYPLIRVIMKVLEVNHHTVTFQEIDSTKSATFDQL